jgi:hypothetical protein
MNLNFPIPINFAIPFVCNCDCPSCNKNLFFVRMETELGNIAKCDDCNISIRKLIFFCDIILNKYIIKINCKTIDIITIDNKIICDFPLEKEFDWDDIGLYYKTSLKYIENIVFV